MKTLIFGYGNVDRQDDGAAWHILINVAEKLGITPPDELGEFFENVHPQIELAYDFQLLPELAENISHYDQVCFIDAHTGAIEEELSFKKLDVQFQNSPLTHHMTPQTLLAITQSIYGSVPHAMMLSIRGYEFGFSHTLSTRTQLLVNQAADTLIAWLNTSSKL